FLQRRYGERPYVQADAVPPIFTELFLQRRYGERPYVQADAVPPIFSEFFFRGATASACTPGYCRRREFMNDILPFSLNYLYKIPPYLRYAADEILIGILWCPK
ncbi:MAG TPA: hypothetical protein PLJ85_03520, partial [Candidatus Cloacimonas sp.]|nr:hypothetical protein [Candidatus Cloacimonas sp.]